MNSRGLFSWHLSPLAIFWSTFQWLYLKLKTNYDKRLLIILFQLSLEGYLCHKMKKEIVILRKGFPKDEKIKE